MIHSLLQSLKTNRLLIGLAILSLAVNFMRIPVLNGTFAGLVVAVFLQLIYQVIYWRDYSASTGIPTRSPGLPGYWPVDWD